MRLKARTDERGTGDLALIAKTIGLLVVLMSVVSAFIFGGMVIVDRVIMPAYTHLGAEVELPDIVEKDFYEARQELTALGLQLEKSGEEFHAVIETNKIIEQVPPAYSKVKKGRMVGVIVSRGPEMIVIPDVTRLSEDVARQRINQAGLIVGTVSRRPDDAPAGTVISQSPSANTTALRTRVDLVVSTGPGDITVTIPRFVNAVDVHEAIRRIRELGGRVWVEWVRDDNSLMNTVVAQDPQPGTRVAGVPIFRLKVSILNDAAVPALLDTVGIGAPPPLPDRGGMSPRGFLFPPPVR